MRKGYTIYTISVDAGFEYFTNKAAAIRAAKRVMKDEEPHTDEIEVEKCEMVAITLETLLDILRSNGGNWCASSEVVEVVRR